MIIAPREAFRASFDAAGRRLRTELGDVDFGVTGKAYLLDAGRWRAVPPKHLTEGDLPDSLELEGCADFGEVARKLLGE